MTAIDEAVQVMQQAIEEVERLRAINAELLAALKAVVAEDRCPDDAGCTICDRAKQAIANAEGRS